MKKLLLILFLIGFFGMNYSNAQEKQQTEQTTKKKSATKTNYQYPYKGKMVAVYQGSKGGYFIYCISGKTGKEYKKYLKKEQLAKHNDI